MNADLDAILQELGAQRMLLGDRAATLAGQLAQAQKENAALKQKLEELEKSADADKAVGPSS